MSLFGTPKYSKLSLPARGERKMVIPDGSWIKCRNCGQTLYADRLEDNHQVCWYCGRRSSLEFLADTAKLGDELSGLTNGVVRL